MFQLTPEEFIIWKSQIVTSNSLKMGLRKRPYAFTEQGIAMLSAVLNSSTAVEVSIHIMKVFVESRRNNSSLILSENRIEIIERTIILQEKKFEELFQYLNEKTPAKSGIFFNDQWPVTNDGLLMTGY